MADEKQFPLKIDRQDRLPLLLVAVTLFGLILKFLLALNIELNSDSVVPGLQAMEIFRHGDTFLSGFYFPVNYPAIFTDLMPFHLAIQLLANFNPTALRLTGFLIYLLILAVYTSIIYKVTKDKVKALLFMALMSNLTPGAYSYFIQPVSHGATVLFTGIILFFLLDYEKLRLFQKALLAIAVFLVSFSDNMALAILAIPFTLVYLYNMARNKKIAPVTTIITIVFVLIPAVAAYALKSFLPRMVSLNIDLITTYKTTGAAIGLLPDKISVYLMDLLSVFNDQLYSLANGEIGVFEVVSLVLFILILSYALRNVIQGYKADGSEQKLFILIILAANVVLLLGFMFTTLGASRYLLFTSLSLVAFIALGYDRSRTYLALAALVLILGIIGCALAVSHLDYRPNEMQYDLINYLEANNLTVGYSDYWDANIISYLSDEKVQVRAIGYNNGYIVPYHLLSSSRWYEGRPTKFFILYHVNHDYGSIGAITSAIEWKSMKRFGEYYIFIYDMDHSPMIS